MALAITVSHHEEVQALGREAAGIHMEVRDIKRVLRWSLPLRRYRNHTAITAHLRGLEGQIAGIRREIDRLHDEADCTNMCRGITFTRPWMRLPGAASRMLGPLPQDATMISPTTEELATVRGYRLLGLALVIGAVATLITLTSLLPWMAISPVMLVNLALTQLVGADIAGYATPIVCLYLAIVSTTGTSMPGYKGKFLDRAAMFEEQWFRMGAESWTTQQRLRSCVAFSIVHVTNIIYPLSSLIVVGLVGGVFMMVYLREYKRSGSTKQATLASSKLHATYNRFSFLYMFVALGIGLILTLVMA